MSYSCYQLSAHLEDDTMDATGACVYGQQYYLVYPDGDAVQCHSMCYDHGPCQNVCADNKFSMPPGLDSLSGGNFDGVSTADLIRGSVRTWKKNGNANGGGFADPTNQGTIENRMDMDVTTPGFMRIPVCSPERAFQSWVTANPGPATSTPAIFHQPLVDDCLTIIKNIEGDATTDYTTQVLGKNQREFVAHASCHFGVEAAKEGGNADIVVGGQDVIDIIKESVKQFARDGKVGAKDNMDCNGNIKGQPVLWGIY